MYRLSETFEKLRSKNLTPKEKRKIDCVISDIYCICKVDSQHLFKQLEKGV